jgi:hypothetical protein
MAHIPPEMRVWRTDIRSGRQIYALLSNDVTRPSDDDPMIGVMESSVVAEDIVSTHNGALSKYGRRYPSVLGRALEKKPATDTEVYFQVNAGEREQLLQLTEWLINSPFRPLGIVQKLHGIIVG